MTKDKTPDTLDFGPKDSSDRIITFDNLQFKNGAKLTLICAKTKEKLRGVNRFLPIVDTEILGEQND